MSVLQNIRVVLVNTAHPGNIGASARAMKNMGLNQIILVQPKDFPSGVAIGRAASATDILESAVVVDSLQEAVADCGLVICASARSRKIPWPMLDPQQTAQKVVEEMDYTKIALVFGREDSGLSNEELQLGHFHVQIPAEEKYSSLNLAAAVLVICYEIRKVASEKNTHTQGQDTELWDQEFATGDQVEHFYRHLEQVMIDIKFHDPSNPRQLMQRIRRLFGRIRLDVMELNILRGILTNIEQSMKRKKN
ncbi:MAG: tRNA (cytosine(32)/uridine(32)-2'-O)-methyltransferase TrmJ [Gammaproteobacteria bacterium]|nr:tRNA (cytosine(32)/uridine(32)-2'-O)-methyltransferase TrmJ [Gammaproteobacteria bacterium]